MAKSVFFSFHYSRDAWRVQQVANMGALEGQPILNAQEWEEVKRQGDASIKKWIADQMAYKSALVVLIGDRTLAGRGSDTRSSKRGTTASPSWACVSTDSPIETPTAISLAPIPSPRSSSMAAGPLPTTFRSTHQVDPAAKRSTPASRRISPPGWAMLTNEAECPFCLIASGRDPDADVVFEDALVVGFTPPEPATLGHTILIAAPRHSHLGPRRHRRRSPRPATLRVARRCEPPCRRRA